MSFKGGVDEAVEDASGPRDGRGEKASWLHLRKKDPKNGPRKPLERKLISMEDLQYLTPAMLVGLLRDVDLETFGLALRAVDQEVVDKLMSMVSTGIRLDIEDGLKGRPSKG